MTSAIEVVAPGIASTIQDRGRTGYAHLGVSPSGAVDPRLASLTNRLVGNPDRSRRDRDVRWPRAALHRGGVDRDIVGVGADLDRRRRDVPASPVTSRASGTTSPCAAGSTCRRCWDRGRRDTLSGLGPPPLAAGHVLPIGRRAGVAARGRPGTRDTAHAMSSGSVPDRGSTGSTPVSFERFVAGTWTVTESSRVGVRLSGVRLRATDHARPPERRAGAWRDPGSARQRSGDAARRPSDDRRLSGDRRRRPRRRGRGRSDTTRRYGPLHGTRRRLTPRR